MQAGIAAIQILYEVVVHNLSGVSKALCGYALGVCDLTTTQECWSMHQEIHLESTSK